MKLCVARLWTLAIVTLVATGLPLTPSYADSTPTPVELPPVSSTASLQVIDTERARRDISFKEIEALGLHRVTTSTFWPNDDGTYEGVLLSTLLAENGLADADAIKVSALDDFSQVIPRHHWEKWSIILATRRDGDVMTARKKGPFRIIYPRDSDPELEDMSYRLLWVWMVKRIEPAMTE